MEERRYCNGYDVEAKPPVRAGCNVRERLQEGKLPMSGDGGEVCVEWASWAPGRLDLLGGVADVGGALTLQYPLSVAGVEVRMRVTLGPRGPGQSHKIRVWDEGGGEPARCEKIDIAPILEVVDTLAGDCRSREAGGGEPESRTKGAISPVTKEALKLLGKLPGGWAHHVVGCILGFHVQGSSLGWCLCDIGESANSGSKRGLNRYPPWTLLEVFTGPGAGSVNHLPPGQGGASSAAVQIATLRCYWGVLQALDLHFGTEEAAELMHLNRRDFDMFEHFAVLAQAVENFAVGSPCGIMDQVACSCGQEGQLLPVWCSLEDKFNIAKRSYDFCHGFELQPPSMEEPRMKRRRVPLARGRADCARASERPEGDLLLPGYAMVIGWPSGKKHSHVGSQSPYSIARAALFMGKALISRRIKTKTPFPWESQHGLRGETPGEAARQALIIDPSLSSGFSLGSPCCTEEDGQVAAGPCEGTGKRSLGSVLKHYIDCLPERLTGRDFKAQCPEPLADPLSFVGDDTLYPVRAAFSFSIEANEQAEVSLLLLQSVSTLHEASGRGSNESSSPPQPSELAALKAVGEMMFKQHRSYSDMGLGSPETDEIVAFLRNKFPHDVFGARVGGGGCGGTVVILCNRRAYPAICAEVLERAHRTDGETDAGPGLRILA